MNVTWFKNVGFRIQGTGEGLEKKDMCMVVRTLENLENLEMSGKKYMVRENLENLEKSGNFFFLTPKSFFCLILQFGCFSGGFLFCIGE